MHPEIISLLKLTLKLYIFFTLLYCVVKKNKNRLLVSILTVTVFNVIATDILRYYKLPIVLNNNIYIIVHQLLWLLVLRNYSSLLKANLFILFFYSLLATINFFFWDGPFILNTMTFVYSALLYLLLFICECFFKLREENLDYFLNNNFILISSPLLFLIGYSFMFGFKSKLLNDIELAPNFKLFDLISYFVNFIFYTLINIYIYKERSVNNAT